MCHVFITHYLCGHSVIVGSRACANGMHPLICHPGNLRTVILSYNEVKLTGFNPPQNCPASINGRPCIPLPEDPIAFANLCLKNGLGIEDVAALAPAWIFDVNGNKVGSKSGPWRVTDYVSTFYMCKNPTAMRNRLSMSRKAKTRSRKLRYRRQAARSGEMKFKFGPSARVPGYIADSTQGAVF